MCQKVKKLVAVLEKIIDEKEELERISCIWYPIIFKDQTEALLYPKSKVNEISQAFTFQ